MLGVCGWPELAVDTDQGWLHVCYERLGCARPDRFDDLIGGHWPAGECVITLATVAVLTGPTSKLSSCFPFDHSA